MAGFVAAALDHLICIVKRKLKKIRHRPCLMAAASPPSA
jgi:hypothetical protein